MHDLLCKLFDWYSKTWLAKGIQRICIGDLEQRIHRLIQFDISTAVLHQKTFGPYKNKFVGCDVALIACGPSLNKYQPIPGVINIGVNRAYKFKDVKLDYLFVNDGGKSFSRDDMNAINNYRIGECQKFYGLFDEQSTVEDIIISEDEVLKAHALRYRVEKFTDIWCAWPRYTFDIETQAIGGMGTTAASALQFIMWCHPKRVYLVGCDCTASGGHFYETTGPSGINASELYKSYLLFKEFVARYYPDTEIISVNPVGLKGVFKDLYQ